MITTGWTDTTRAAANYRGRHLPGLGAKFVPRYRMTLCIGDAPLCSLQGVRHFDGPQDGELSRNEATRRSDRRDFDGLTVKED